MGKFGFFQTTPKFHFELDEATEKAITADQRIEKDLFPGDNAKSKKLAADDVDLDDVDDNTDEKKKSK